MKADKEKVKKLLATARGQINGILNMIDEDKYCIDISNQLMATQSILKKVSNEILSSHMMCCVNNAQGEDREQKIEEVLAIIQKMNK